MREMKDSGVEWIGEIPKEWKLSQVRYLFRIGRGRVIAQTEIEENGIYPVFSSQTKNNGCLGYINTYDFDLEQITWTTDGANAGTVFLRSGKHNCTNVCGTLQPFIKELNMKYQKYALEHIAFYHKRADTNGYKIMNNEMAAIHTIIPPYREQERIANYLDSKCSLIDNIIDKQQAIIEKLKGYKYSKYFEYIDLVHNTKVSLGKVINKIEQGWSPPPSERQDDNGWKVLTLAAVKFGKFSEKENKPFDGRKDKCEKLLLKSGDFLLTRSNTRKLVGQVCIVDDVDEQTIFSDLIYRITFNTKYLLPEYALFVLQTPKLRQQISRDAHGSSSTMVKITHKDISNWEIVIEKLMEYKKSLIYEVVTGKKEV